MGRGAFIVALGPFERSEKRQYQEELERIRDAALELTKALDADAAQDVAYWFSPREYRIKGKDWQSGADLLCDAHTIFQAAEMALDPNFSFPYGDVAVGPPQGGRPNAARARHLALTLARIFLGVKGAPPTFGTDAVTREPSTDYARLVKSAFAAGGLEKSWTRAAAWAVNETRKKIEFRTLVFSLPMWLLEGLRN